MTRCSAVALRGGALSAALLLALAVSAALSGVSSAMTWKPCEGREGPVSVSEVTLSPDPPVIGTPATFSIFGSSSAPTIASGTVDMTIQFGGVDIFANSEDLCQKATCPIQQGPVKITLVEYLPPIAPPGTYGMRLEGHGTQKEELFCLFAEFELTPP
mmetsp:Transcript_23477/g.69755  ORF Transcript_23477/g.69755 Transcript_23477/m.69755 type:complete len:158 (-) Transcript_23477:207-680(-)